MLDLKLISLFDVTEFTDFKYYSTDLKTKYLITTDSRNTVRMHSIIGIDKIYEKSKQNIGDSIAQIMTSRVVFLSYPQTDDVAPPRLSVKNICVLNSEYFLVGYVELNVLDVFTTSGIHMTRLNIEVFFSLNEMSLKSINRVKLPRLAWTDRYLDIVHNTQKMIPRKYLIATTLQDTQSEYDALILYDKDQTASTQIKCMKKNEKITALDYGPFDNGYILVGLSNGKLVGL